MRSYPQHLGIKAYLVIGVFFFQTLRAPGLPASSLSELEPAITAITSELLPGSEETLLSGSELPESIPEKKITVFADSQLRLPQGGIVKIKDELPLSKLGEFFDESFRLSAGENENSGTGQEKISNEKLLLPPEGRPIEVNILVPKGISFDDEEIFVNTIKEQMMTHYGVDESSVKEIWPSRNNREGGVFTLAIPRRLINATAKKIKGLFSHKKSDHRILFRVKTVYVDVEAIEDLGEDIERAYEHDSASAAQSPEMGKIRKKYHRAVALRLKKWKNNFSAHVRNIRLNREAALMDAGSAIGFIKSYGGITYWLSVTGFNIFGIAQSSMSLVLDQIFSRWIQRINDWKANHQFKYLKTNRLIKYYNTHPNVKAFVINQAISFFAASYFRLMSHLNNPETIAAPWSKEFLSIFTGLAIAGTGVGALGDVAPNRLRRNNRLSALPEWLIYQGYGIMFVVNGLLFGSGNIGLLPIGLAAEWLPKLALSGISYALPPKDNHFTIIHDGIQGEALRGVKYTYGLKDHGNGQKWAYTREELEKNPELYRLPDTRSFKQKLKEDTSALKRRVANRARNIPLKIHKTCRELFAGGARGK